MGNAFDMPRSMIDMLWQPESQDIIRSQMDGQLEEEAQRPIWRRKNKNNREKQSNAHARNKLDLFTPRQQRRFSAHDPQ